MKRSVYDYYPIALAEDEGAGTAYEYYVKARLLHKLYKGRNTPRKILVAGLPETYGLSMDFALLAQDWKAEILFIDERPDRLTQFANTYDTLSEQGALSINYLRHQTVKDISGWELKDKFDLLLCCEVLQRLDAEQQLAYFSKVTEYAKTAVFFAPNAENPHHAQSSGLSTVSLAQLESLAKKTDATPLKTGWLDVPPFPPGITRSDSQREDALSSPWQRFLFWGINVWADAEGLMPASFRKKRAHIVYMALQTGARHE